MEDQIAEPQSCQCREKQPPHLSDIGPAPAAPQNAPSFGGTARKSSRLVAGLEVETRVAVNACSGNMPSGMPTLINPV